MPMGSKISHERRAISVSLASVENYDYLVRLAAPSLYGRFSRGRPSGRDNAKALRPRVVAREQTLVDSKLNWVGNSML